MLSVHWSFDAPLEAGAVTLSHFSSPRRVPARSVVRGACWERCARVTQQISFTRTPRSRRRFSSTPDAPLSAGTVSLRRILVVVPRIVRGACLKRGARVYATVTPRPPFEAEKGKERMWDVVDSASRGDRCCGVITVPAHGRRSPLTLVRADALFRASEVRALRQGPPGLDNSIHPRLRAQEHARNPVEHVVVSQLQSYAGGYAEIRPAAPLLSATLPIGTWA